MMADKELESFILKFKSLCVAGITANINAVSNEGNVTVSLTADVGRFPTSLGTGQSDRFRGPTYRRAVRKGDIDAVHQIHVIIKQELIQN